MDGRDAVIYVLENNIPGVFVECGCGNGNFQIAWIRELKKQNEKRHMYLYDTFAGLTEPNEKDFTVQESTQYTMTKDEVYKIWTANKQSDTVNNWCNWSVDQVKNTLRQEEYDETFLHYIVGDVRQTLLVDSNLPDQISMLRLDTDWYDSTLVELQRLYHKVSPKGIVILDDYFHWNGQQEATLQFLNSLPSPPSILRVDAKTAAFFKN